MRAIRIATVAVMLAGALSLSGCGGTARAPQSGESVLPTSAPGTAPGEAPAQGAVGDLNSTIQQEQQGVDENTNQ